MAYNYGNMGFSQNYGNYYGNAPMNGAGYSNGIQQPQMNYQQIPQQPQMSYQAPTQNQSIIWVQGEADMTGRPLPMESYDLVKRDSVVNIPQISQKAQPAQMSEEYVKMSDLEGKVNDMVEKAVNKALAK